jgi:hypothetical protein
MAAVTACDFESAGPAGTVLTNANTGGTVSIGVGAAAVSTAVAAFGSLAGQFDVPATNVSSRVTSAVAGSPLQIQISYKFRIPAAFATSKRMFIVQNTALGTVCSINYNGTTDRVQLQNSAGAGTVTVANTLPLDVWYRVELDLTIATAATGAYVLNLYANDSKVPINAVPFTGAAYDLGTVAVGALQHGINTNGTAVAATVLIDSVRYDAGGTTELGPESIPVTAGGSVGIGGTAPARKAAPAVTSAALGVAGVSGAGKRALSVTRAAAGLTGNGASTKRATVAGRATAGLSGTVNGRKAARAAAARALVGLGGAGGGRKSTAVTGRATIGLWGALGPIVVPPTIGTHLGAVGPRASLVGSAGGATMTGTTGGGSSLIGGTR